MQKLTGLILYDLDRSFLLSRRQVFIDRAVSPNSYSHRMSNVASNYISAVTAC